MHAHSGHLQTPRGGQASLLLMQIHRINGGCRGQQGGGVVQGACPHRVKASLDIWRLTTTIEPHVLLHASLVHVSDRPVAKRPAVYLMTPQSPAAHIRSSEATFTAILLTITSSGSAPARHFSYQFQTFELNVKTKLRRAAVSPHAGRP